MKNFKNIWLILCYFILSPYLVNSQDDWSSQGITYNDEISVSDCVGYDNTKVGSLDKKLEQEADDEAKKIIKKAIKKALKKVTQKVIKQYAYQKALKKGFSKEKATSIAKQAEKDASRVMNNAERAVENAGGDDAIEAGIDAVGDATVDFAADLGAEVAVDLATDPSPLGVTIAAALVAGNAIYDAIKNNDYGNPKKIYIDIDKAKNGGYYLRDASDILVWATPKEYDKPRIILHHKHNGYWKGIVKFNKNKKEEWEEVVCVNGDKRVSANYISDELFDNYRVTISEGKMFDVHSNMYAIRNIKDFGLDHDWHFFYDLKEYEKK